jgi:hypothetical protein
MPEEGNVNEKPPHYLRFKAGILLFLTLNNGNLCYFSRP